MPPPGGCACEGDTVSLHERPVRETPRSCTSSRIVVTEGDAGSDPGDADRHHPPVATLHASRSEAHGSGVANVFLAARSRRRSLCGIARGAATPGVRPHRRVRGDSEGRPRARPPPVGDNGGVPEGDSVYQVARRLRAALVDRPLTVTDFRVPALATVDLTGRSVLAVVPRGKHLLTRIEGDLTLHTHLRMDGTWEIHPTGSRPLPRPWHAIRLVLANATRTAVGMRMPVVELLRTADEATAVGGLGPDLLGPDWDPVEAARRLAERPDRPIGEALLDQRNLAGIGNVYRAELCFLRGITPWTPVAAAGDPHAWVALAHRLLYANRDRIGHVTTGDTRPGRRHWVYGRGGRPCARCGTSIRRADLGDPPRVAFWCPRCQVSPDGSTPGDRRPGGSSYRA